jgi:hypothetical protein
MSQAQTALEICMLGASSLKDGSPRWQCSVPVGNDNDDVLPFGDVAVYQGLGLSGQPFPKDADGFAEAVIAPNVGNRKAVVIGARDTRDADIVGKLDPGDTVVHATGPGKKPQIQLKKKKRSASIVVPCEDGTDVLVTVDGKGHKVLIIGWGLVFQLSKADGITLKGNGKGGIVINGDNVAITGNLRLPGMAPGMQIVTAPIAGLPVPGVTPGVGATVAPFTPLGGVGGTV